MLYWHARTYSTYETAILLLFQQSDETILVLETPESAPGVELLAVAAKIPDIDSPIEYVGEYRCQVKDGERSSCQGVNYISLVSKRTAL